MTEAVVDRDPVTRALVDLLATVTGRPWGDGEPPLDTSVPYGLVYEIPGGVTEGPAFSTPDADAALVYQTTCVGDRREQAGRLADRARHALTGRDDDGNFVHAIASQALDDAGLVVEHREPQATGGVDREGKVFSATDRFVVVVRSADLVVVDGGTASTPDGGFTGVLDGGSA